MDIERKLCVWGVIFISLYVMRSSAEGGKREKEEEEGGRFCSNEKNERVRHEYVSTV